MSDEQLWERMEVNGEEEPNLWYDRFVLYLHMGPSRSLLGTVHLEEKAQKSPKKPSGSIPGAWKDAANLWNWKQRAEAYDEYRRKQVFTQGNAYDVTRVEKLNKYAEELELQIDRMLKSLPKRPKKPWFNHFMYDKYLQTLDALAQETGGRVKKQESTVQVVGKVGIYLPQKDVKGGETGVNSDNNQ